jgi:hypothetical protein
VIPSVEGAKKEFLASVEEKVIIRKNKTVGF